MRKGFFFFLLGLVSLWGQAVILREIVNLSYGNEFIYSLGLGLWLFLVGLGSVAGRRFKGFAPKFLWLILILWFLSIPLLVIGLRVFASKLIIPGQLLSFSQALLLLFFPLLIFCPALGGLFVVGKKSLKSSLNSAYFWETIGFFVGGIVFSFFLAKTSFPLIYGTDRTNPPSPSESEGFGRASRAFLEGIYPGLKRVINSPYQQIIETESGGQTNIYLSGQLAFSSQQKQEQELLAGLVFPLAPSVDKILVAGSPSLASVMALYSRVKQIEFLELDPTLLKIEKEFLNSRIKPKLGDLKIYLGNSPLDYDLIAINLPLPTSLFLNRFYTQEFFKIVQKSLKKEGVFALIFPLPTGYQSQEALRFARSIYQTFESVFGAQFTSEESKSLLRHHPRWSYLFALEDQVILLGGVEKIEPKQNELDFLEKIYPSFSADYFRYQITKPSRTELVGKLESPKEELNRDTFPVAFFYQTLFWQTLFSFKIPKILFRLRAWGVLGFLGVLFMVFLKVNQRRRKFLVVSCSSFILMSLQIILIFLFQTKFGSVYSQIAFLNGLVLLGMAIGVRGVRPPFAPIKSGLRRGKGIWGYVLVMLGVVWGIRGNWGGWGWWGMALFLGFSGGSIFALISNQFSGKKEQTLVYAFDLLGAFLGAIFSGLFFFPALGLYKTLLVLVALIILVCWRG